MSCYPSCSQQPSFSLLSRAFAFRPGARFTGLLDPAFFGSLADKHHVHFGTGASDTFNPAVTLWAWLSQLLSPRKSCVAAVARVLVLCCSLSRPLCSANAGAFCKARGKLPADFLKDAAVQLGRSVEQRAPSHWRWKGRTVKVVDGSTVQLPDTQANLAVYPQQRSQKPGTSPTCLRLVVVLALASAALLDAATGAYRGKGSGEMSLLYSMWGQFQPGDVVLADRYYGCYLLLAGLPQRGVDGCFRLPVQREKDFASGQRLGPDDWLQSWDKPRRPKWIDADEWAKLPQQVQVRVLRLQVARPGWRCQKVYLVTTLTDAKAYPAADIAALYLARWNAELAIDELETHQRERPVLRSQTPAGVIQEIEGLLLGHYVARAVMLEAASEQGLDPRRLSFTATLKILRSRLAEVPADASDEQGRRRWWDRLVLEVGEEVLPPRRNRINPRVIKRKMSKWPKKRPHHLRPPQPTMPFEDSIVIT